MRPYSRVVWNEGMHLAQHHFQAQSRYFEESIDFALSTVCFKPFGIVGLELDAEALRNGTASLVHARGIMPDGLAFHIPEGDPAPPARDIRDDFLPTQDRQVLYLAIPRYRYGQANCALDSEDGARDRYLAQPVPLLDETTGRDEKTVIVGRKNFRLALEAELDDGDVSLPLARIRRDGAGQFVYDPAFIPPCLQIGASPRILDLLRRLVEMLSAKSEHVASERGQATSSLAEYGPKEVAGFWLLHSLHQSLVPLRHHLETRRAHPEELYRELARLAGALCTFSLGSDPRDVPNYDHENLTDTFGELERHIRRHLEITIPTTCATIPLQRHPKYIYLHSAAIQDGRAFGSSEWILGVRSAARQAAIIRDVPSLVKLASKRDLAALVKEGTAGLTLEHLPSPPSQISPRVGNQYFRIARSGPLWRAIQETSEIGAYVPEAIPEPELELLILLEG